MTEEKIFLVKGRKTKMFGWTFDEEFKIELTKEEIEYLKDKCKDDIYEMQKNQVDSSEEASWLFMIEDLLKKLDNLRL